MIQQVVCTRALASPSAAVVPRALLAMGINGNFCESIREVSVRVKL